MRNDFPAPRFVDSNGIRLAVHEAGSGPSVILLHGFPELAYSWRHQLPALAAAGYRAIAPDLRGYGRSDKPPAVGDYRLDILLDDLTGLLDAYDLRQAIFVGHDWGALLLWQLALTRPEVMRGLVCLNIPFMPHGDRDPVDLMRERLGDDFYIVNFQDSDEADRSFARDPARFINNVMRRGQITRARYDGLPRQRKVISLLAAMEHDTPGGEPLLDDEELGYYAAAFAAGGFTGPINWYRNWSENWAAGAGIEQVVRVPTLFIGAEDDVIVSPKQIEAMRPHVPDLETRMIEGCGHWTQQEQPDLTNRLLLDWLQRRFPGVG
jgi:pimeloyl-ACP methyl ester carboxylesterase